MGSTKRVPRGHALVGAGLLVRRASLPAATFVLTLLILAGFGWPAAAPGAAWVIGVPLALLVVGRVVAVGLGALGWLTFPAEHRAVLAELASKARPLR